MAWGLCACQPPGKFCPKLCVTDTLEHGCLSIPSVLGEDI